MTPKLVNAQFRVLAGRYSGVSHPLVTKRISIGHEYWHDIVLREPATAGLALELELGDGGLARLAVLSGWIDVLGVRLTAGANAVLPPFVPLIIGGVAFAWGQADSARWAEAEALLADTTAMPAPALDAGNDFWRQIALPGAVRFVRSTLALSAALAVGAVAMVPMNLKSLSSPELIRDRAVAALAKAGYSGLSVRAEADGTITVAGRIASEADRPAISFALAEAEIPATLALRSDTELARAVADSARLYGFVVTARSVDGAIEVHHGELDPSARERLLQVIRRDVPGLGRLNLVGDNVGGTASPLASVSDATLRVSSVIAGDPGFILTADGGRYFPGAVLPSGHRLVAIETAVVVLERGGQQTRLAF